MIILCSGKSSANIFIENPNTGEKEELWELDLIGFGSATNIIENGTNYDGSKCFSNDGKFNGMKISHCSTYFDASSGTLSYWNFETQNWGG